MAQKQSILGRIAQLTTANINALIDKAEDPQKMLDQMVRDYTNSHRRGRAGRRADDRQPAAGRGRPRRGRRRREGVGRQGARRLQQGRPAARLGPGRRGRPLRPARQGRAGQADRRRERGQGRRPDDRRSRARSSRSSRPAWSACRASSTSCSPSATSSSPAHNTAEAQAKVNDAIKSIDILDPDQRADRYEDQRPPRRGEGRSASRSSPRRSLDAQFAELEADAGQLEVEARLAELKGLAAAPRRPEENA